MNRAILVLGAVMELEDETKAFQIMNQDLKTVIAFRKQIIHVRFD